MLFNGQLRGFVIFLVFLAGNSLFGTPTDDKNKKRTDTCHVIEASTYDRSDSLLMFPSYDLYESWDTCAIHPDLFNMQFQGDTAVVYLLDDWGCGFSLPYKGILTSGFGWRHGRPHFGTDISLHTGDTVLSAFEGKVRIARFVQGYGNVVIIRHQNGLETVYGHLSKILVQQDEQVSSGEFIGLGGNTGHSFGSHLHFEMRYLGKALDAEDLVDFDKGEVKNNSFVIFKEDFSNHYDLRKYHTQKSSKSHALSRFSATEKYSKIHGNVTTVRKGDSLEKIAKRFHSTIDSICKKNHIKRGKILQIGQKLKV